MFYLLSVSSQVFEPKPKGLKFPLNDLVYKPGMYA